MFWRSTRGDRGRVAFATALNGSFQPPNGGPLGGGLVVFCHPAACIGSPVRDCEFPKYLPEPNEPCGWSFSGRPYWVDCETHGGPLGLPRVKPDSQERCKPVIGLSGGIASGKSLAAKILSGLGAAVIDSDELVGLEMREAEVIETYRSWWGDRVCAPDGRIDRRAVADIVFSDPRERDRLEAYLFPRLELRRKRMVAGMRNDPAVRAIVLDSPLLYEAGLDKSCDVVIFIDTERSVRLRRAMETRGWTDGELDRREKSQKPLDIKAQAADYRVANNSSAGALRSQLETIVDRLLTSQTPGPGAIGRDTNR